MIKKIALEEHFLCPGFEEYWTSTVANVPVHVLESLSARLFDFGELRIGAMNAAGISRSALSVSGPGVQAERDRTIAVRKARDANDFLAGRIQAQPDRYSGFAHLALQDPLAAADELERCVRDLGFCGAMINGHTHGVYLDHPSFFPFWERAEALATLIYIHPADPVAPVPALDGHPGLQRATWGWGFETGTHALRLIFGGVFDRFPRARLALGHLGETLPFLLWRLDSRAKLYDVKLDRRPSDYIRDNIVVTLSGMYSAEPLLCTIAAMGAERVMFSADYPFESTAEAGAFMDSVAVPEAVRAQIAFQNAERLLGLIA